MDGIFGTKHWIGLGCMAAYMLLFFLITSLSVNRRGMRARRCALGAIYFFMLLLELLKFILLFRKDGYIDHGGFPFHLCSMPLYLFPFVIFGKSRLSVLVQPAACTIGLIAGLITILYPSNVLDPGIGWLHDYGYNLASISFLYHTSMIIFAVYILAGGIYKPRALDAAKAFSVLFVLSMAALLLNAVIPGADYFLLGYGYGNPLNVLIAKAGKFVYVLVMMAVASVIILLLYSGFIVKELYQRMRKQKKQMAEESNHA